MFSFNFRLMFLYQVPALEEINPFLPKGVWPMFYHSKRQQTGTSPWSNLVDKPPWKAKFKTVTIGLEQ